MDPSMIHPILQEYKEGVGRLAQQLPEVVRRYHEFTEACFEEGALDKKTKHLIGLVLATYSSDKYCIIYHMKGAIDQMASNEEILEAAAVAGAFGGGMAMSQLVTIVQNELIELREKTH